MNAELRTPGERRERARADERERRAVRERGPRERDDDGDPAGQPLALAFSKVATATDAEQAFVAWVEGAGSSLLEDTSGTKLRHAPEPVYLPFFAFEGALHVEYAGKIGYSYRVKKISGKGHTTKWRYYQARGIGVPPKTLGAADPSMVVYGGFTYRRPHVTELARATFAELAAARRQADPDGAEAGPAAPTVRRFEPSMLPGTGRATTLGPFGPVEGFDAPVEYCYSRAAEATGELASRMADTHLRECPDVEFERIGARQYEGVLDLVFGGDDNSRNPSGSGFLSGKPKPDRFEVQVVDGQLLDGQLAEGGALLMPFWVCEYARGEDKYRAFVCGHSGRVEGICHVNLQMAQYAGAAGFGLLGVAAAVLTFKLMLPFPMGWVLPLSVAAGGGGGAATGWFLGQTYAQQCGGEQWQAWQAAGQVCQGGLGAAAPGLVARPGSGADSPSRALRRPGRTSAARRPRGTRLPSRFGAPKPFSGPRNISPRYESTIRVRYCRLGPG
jgi:hypothetical protein